MANIAAEVRRDKEAHPERYCPNPRCLFRTDTRRGYVPCPKHPEAQVAPEKGGSR